MVRELADKIKLIIREYYDSGDINETIHCLKELNIPHFLHEFIYELIDFCFDKNTKRLVCSTNLIKFNDYDLLKLNFIYSIFIAHSNYIR